MEDQHSNIIKPRFESEELRILRSLNSRMDLSSKEAAYYANLEKGFLGEKYFDILLGRLQNDCLILNDLLLESNNSLFQIDSLLISKGIIYLYDVKNFEGDFYIEDDRWYTLSGTEIKNPLFQLKRCELLLRSILKSLGFNSPIESYLVFVNPEFYLYQAPANPNMIFPTQLNRFIEKTDKSLQKYNDRHVKLAEQLLKLHIKKPPYNSIPEYSYDQLKKGITCAKCHSFFDKINGKTMICSKCGNIEDVSSAVLRSVTEFRTLFANEKITTNRVWDWCKIVDSKKMLQRILAENYIQKGHSVSSYYDDLEDISDGRQKSSQMRALNPEKGEKDKNR